MPAGAPHFAHGISVFAEGARESWPGLGFGEVEEHEEEGTEVVR